MRKTVSIITPTHNRAAILAETVGSIQQQSYPAWEAIVVDDGSTDHTHQMMSEICERDHRIRFLPSTGESRGAPAARNRGLREARGEFVAFLDSDDLLASHCLEKRVAVLERFSDVQFVVGLASTFVDPSNPSHTPFQTWDDHADIERFLSFRESWQCTGPLWRKSVFDVLGGWNESLTYYQDWELSLRALASQLTYHRLNEVDWHFRRDERPRISNVRVRSVDDTLGLIDAVARLSRTYPNSDSVQLFLPSVCLNLSRRHAFAGSLADALTIWKRCFRSRYITARSWISALPLLTASRAQRFQKPLQSFIDFVDPDCLRSV